MVNLDLLLLPTSKDSHSPSMSNYDPKNLLKLELVLITIYVPKTKFGPMLKRP